MKTNAVYLRILLLSLCVLPLASCTKEDVVIKAKRHSQWVVNNMYRDTVFTYLQSKYLPAKATHELIQRFRETYKPGTLKGGFRNEKYHSNFVGNDEMNLLYYYKSNTQAVKFQFNYEVIKDTFLLKALLIQDLTGSE